MSAPALAPVVGNRVFVARRFVIDDDFDFVVSSTSNSFSLPDMYSTTARSHSAVRGNSLHCTESHNASVINKAVQVDVQQNQLNGQIYQSDVNGNDKPKRGTDNGLQRRRCTQTVHCAAGDSTTTTATVPLLGARLLALLILTASVIISYKMVLITMPHTTTSTEHVLKLVKYAQNSYYELLDWAQESNISRHLNPLLCGFLVAIFSCILVYLDSDVPGECPPSPFTPRSKRQLRYSYRQQQSSALHLGYIMALTAGVVVSALMYYERSDL